MSRPRGVIRDALARSAFELASASPLHGTTWREAAAHAQVGFAAARLTWHNMRRAGDLLDVGSVRVEHARRPMLLCAPAGMQAQKGAAQATAALVEAMRCWAEFK